MNLKVCHLTSVHGRHDTRIFIKECQSLASAGYSVSLIAADGRGDEARDGVSIIGIERSGRGRLGRMTGTVRRVYKKALALNADLYHLHDPELIPAGLRLKRRGKKVIYDVHEDLPRQILSKPYLYPFLRPAIAGIIERFEHFAARRFDGVVTVTDHINGRFLKINRNTVCIKNYPLADELANDVSWADKESQVCYVGGLGRSRGVFELVQAMNDTDVRLVLAGGFESEKDRLQAESMAGWDRVDFRGYVGRGEVAGILGESKAGLVTLHPSERYLTALPIKMFEYMSAGIPVISSNFPLWREIVEGCHCGLCVDPMRPDKIAEAIRWIVDHPTEAEGMGRRGREAVLSRYNWDSQARTLLDLYKKLLDK